MPYKSIADAKSADFPSKLEDIPLSLAQINKLAELYDGIKQTGSADNPMAVAWKTWKELYEKKGDKWVLIKKVKSKVVSGGIEFNPENAANEWIPVAKVGQEGLISPDNKKIIYTKDALANSVETWKGGAITFNHDPGRVWEGEQIIAAKFNNPYLYMQLSEAVRAKLKEESISGCSVEGVPGEILKEDKLNQVKGSKLTLMEYPLLPACKVGEGCGVVSSSILEQVDVSTTANTNTDVNVSSQETAIVVETEMSFDVYVSNNVGSTVKVGTDTVYGTKKELKDREYITSTLMQRGSYYGRNNLQFYDANKAIKIGDTLPSGLTPVHTLSIVVSKQEPVLLVSDTRHLKRETENIEQSSRGGDAKGMDKEEYTTTYTGEQVNERVTSAVAEAETNLRNQQEVDIIALKEAEIKAKEEWETKHEKELKDVAELSRRKAKAMGDFKAKLNLSEEAEKGADVLPVEALEYFNGLDIHLQESPGGVTSGAPKEGEEPKETLKDVKTRFNQRLGRGVKGE